jgi:CHAT domain-containing protein
LVFFNACEAARLRKAATIAGNARAARERLARTTGFAEAFLRGGVANYIGTYWPVGDLAAGEFAKSLYHDLIAGRAIGEAVCTARLKVQALRSADWADYIHYGGADFALKLNAGTRYP